MLTRGRTVQSAAAKGKITVVGVGAQSIFRMALLFCSFFFIVVTIAAMFLWEVFGISGYERKANSLIDQLIGSSTYHIIGWEVLFVFIGLGVFLVLVASVLSYISARIFNLVLDLVGGIELIVGGSRQKRG